VSTTQTHDQSRGFYISNGFLTITSSDIYSNTYGGRYGGGTLNVSENAIHGNTTDGLFNDTASSITATFNWWGNDSGPTHSSNPNGSGDAISDNISYDPWHHNDYWWLVNNGFGLVWSSTSTLMTDLNAAMTNWNDSATGMGIITMTSSTMQTAADV